MLEPQARAQRKGRFAAFRREDEHAPRRQRRRRRPANGAEIAQIDQRVGGDAEVGGFRRLAVEKAEEIADRQFVVNPALARLGDHASGFGRRRQVDPHEPRRPPTQRAPHQARAATQIQRHREAPAGRERVEGGGDQRRAAIA